MTLRALRITFAEFDLATGKVARTLAAGREPDGMAYTALAVERRAAPAR
ncbi:MAG TPA: hypothetical protein VIV57_09660 [Anaeromyxobacter sp.]